MTPPAASEPPPLDSAYINAMAHFYRGELSRSLVWRQRLDTTTTWAITTTSTLCMVGFSFPAVPHFIFFFNLLIVGIMLWIESRRYRFYDAYRARVRMLECHFLMPIVAQKSGMLQGNWRELLCEDLILPAFKISAMEAVGRRLKRNYGFLFAIIWIAWLVKIIQHAPGPIHSWADFYAALAVGQVPEWLVAIPLFGSFVAVVGIIGYATLKTSGEFSEFSRSKSLWRM